MVYEDGNTWKQGCSGKKKADAFIEDGPEYVCSYRIRRCEVVEIHPAYVGTSPGSVVGLATGYGLDGLGIESR